MLGWCQLLRRGAVPPTRLAHAVDVIERNARAQLRLVDDLLDVSRIVVGRFTLQCAPVDAAAIVQAAVESIQPAATQKGVSVHTTLAPDALVARGDGGRLQQAIGNLLSNALKFTPHGGRIDVDLTHRAGGLEIVVRDTGEGIAADALPFVFNRLQQADGHAARRHAGLGLGLAIVRQVVELHGGTVKAESDGPGTGAIFRVWLPTAGAPDVRSSNPETPAVSLREADAAASVRGVRCLVVDDSEDAREMVAALLTTRGAAVTAVDSADAALQSLDRELPDVIVSDLAMPGQSGLEMIGRIRARSAERGGGIPAVALTAYAAPEDRSRSIQAGFDEHLVKPVDASVLFDTVARLRRPA
jgi:CheY-like chemotaxis protein